MKVLVTGGSGFIGSHVVDKLRQRGIAVRVVDLRKPSYREDVEYQPGSLLDLETLRIALNGIDAVYHLVAVADVNDVYADPSYADSINVRGTMNVLEAMRRSGIKRLVYGSTTWVYSDPTDDLVTESTPTGIPSHLYTATKLAAEHYCHAYSTLYGLEPTVLRYGIPYGPRARPTTVLAIFVERALNNQPITIAGDGSQFRQFIYVEDLAEGNVLALKSIAKNKVYNLDGSEKISIKQIAEVVKKIFGNVSIEYGPARAGDFKGKVISSERAHQELEWMPSVSFEEGVKQYVEWRIRNRTLGEVEASEIDEEFLRQL